MARAGMGPAALVAVLLAASAPPATADGTSTSVPASAEEVRPLLVGAVVPGVMLRTPDGATFDLRASIEGKPTVLIFYRGGW